MNTTMRWVLGTIALGFALTAGCSTKESPSTMRDGSMSDGMSKSDPSMTNPSMAPKGGMMKDDKMMKDGSK